MIVIDASVAMSWCFEDESDAYADGVLSALAGEKAVVPELWLLEVTNVLLVAERKKRIRPADSLRFWALLKSLPIEVDGTAPSPEVLLGLGRECRLSAYDAAYLDLAMRRGTPLATLDDALRAACSAQGVPLFES